MDFEQEYAHQYNAAAQALALERGFKVVAGRSGRNTIVLGRRLRKCEVFLVPTIVPDFEIEFYERNTSSGTMRIEDQGVSLESVLDWLEGCSKEELYAKYPEVDYGLRKVLSFRKAISELKPEFQAFDYKIDGGYSIGNLSLESEARGFQLQYCTFSPIQSRICLLWDGTFIAEINGDEIDMVVIADVLQAWVVEAILPTDVVKRYDFVKPNPLAAYYEEGRGLEGEFIESWKETEEFFRTFPGLSYLEAVKFMHSMRAEGYDRVFRAGTSMANLILSRARRHGLSPESPFLKFYVHPEKNQIHISDHQGLDLVQESLEYSETIRQLLKRLAEEPIT